MNAINWFEIPAADFDRAVQFYETMLGTAIRKDVFGGAPHGFLPVGEKGVGGAVVYGNGQPSSEGPLIFLNATDEPTLDGFLARVTEAGGEVLLPKTAIPPQGLMAIIRDVEGNRIGLHSPQSV